MGDVADVWVRYKQDPTPADREALIVAHIPLVRYVASRMMPALHQCVERQDLISYGIFGLIDAIEKFDIHNGVKFATFATYRIRGAITDEMRGQAWEPRRVRARARLVLGAATKLEQQLGRPPTEPEVATNVGMTVAELRRLASDQRMSKVGSLNRVLPHRGHSDAGDTWTLADTIPSEDVTAVSEEAQLLAYRLARAIPLLPEQERVLLQMLYATDSPVMGMSLKDIAQILSVTESWVSLLHTRSMVMLQRTLSGQPL